MLSRLYNLGPTILIRKSYFSTLFSMKLFLLFMKPISVGAGDRDQQGAAPGDGAPWFANQSGDLHRAYDAFQAWGSGGEVGSPGSGSEKHS